MTSTRYAATYERPLSWAGTDATGPGAKQRYYSSNTNHPDSGYAIRTATMSGSEYAESERMAAGDDGASMSSANSFTYANKHNGAGGPSTAPNSSHHLDSDGGAGGNGAGKYVCKVCEKRFTRPSALNVHSHMHTGEKPFDCPVCHRSFSVNSNLRRHMRTHTKAERAEYAS